MQLFQQMISVEHNLIEKMKNLTRANQQTENNVLFEADDFRSRLLGRRLDAQMHKLPDLERMILYVKR